MPVGRNNPNEIQETPTPTGGINNVNRQHVMMNQYEATGYGNRQGTGAAG